MMWTRHKCIRLNLSFFLIFSGLVICDVNWFHRLVIFVELCQTEIWADVYAIPLHIFSLHLNGSCIKNYSYRVFRHLPWQFSLHICHSCIPYHCCAYFGHFIELENLVRWALVLEGKGFSNSWFCLNFFAFPCHGRRRSKRGRFKVRKKIALEYLGNIQSYTYIPITLNTDYLLWHTQLMVCAVKH